MQIHKKHFIGINELTKYDTVNKGYVHVYKNGNITYNISVISPTKSVKVSSTFEHKCRILFLFSQTNVNI